MNRPLPPDELPDPLAELPRSLNPPPGLEGRVVAGLRARGLVRPDRMERRRGGPRRRGWMTAAACLLAALAGGALGWTGRGLADTPPGGPAATTTAADARHYLLLLVEPVPLATDKPLAALVSEYRAWAADLASDGRLVSAGRLEHAEGAYLADAPGGSAPAPGIADVTGFFVLRGGSLAEAEAVAATCPHLRYGGEISVRELAATADPPAPLPAAA